MSERDFSRWCAEKLEEMILAEGPDTVAAFIAEPVMGAGGVIIPPEGYFPEIQKVLRKYDVLMIADEVITGFGRTGNWFGSETYDIEPDIMTIAKGLTSGYVPMSGSVISEEIWQVIKEGPPGVNFFAHGYTYSAHPVAAAAALANLNIMERLDLPTKCAEVGAYFQRRLREVAQDHPLVGEVRGEALLAAVELVKDRETKEEFDPDLLVGPHARQVRGRGGAHHPLAAAPRCGVVLAAAGHHRSRGGRGTCALRACARPRHRRAGQGGNLETVVRAVDGTRGR